MNEKILRTGIFIFAAALHLFVIFFLVFKTEKAIQEAPENARVMKLTDLDEEPPPPEEELIPQVEAIAETMVETDIPPVQIVVAPGTIITPSTVVVEEEHYLLMHEVSVPPQFNANEIAADLVYPPIALRSGIEGRVILELFIDRTGTVQKISILREEPEGRGFGDAAIKAFTGRKGRPAMANGEPVSARYRYPVTFKIK
ncbi:MAG: energy transducer TonB [Treponema sp.]|jgi:protein TonB|nr:energy transducer TonB [Treponema sp.]